MVFTKQKPIFLSPSHSWLGIEDKEEEHPVGKGGVNLDYEPN